MADERKWAIGRRQKQDPNVIAAYRAGAVGALTAATKSDNWRVRAAAALALGRMDHSTIKDEFYLANPTVPNYGIDKMYQDSDQRVWMIECTACGKENCLELEFPSCLQRQTDRSGKRVCRKCGNEINRRKGYWITKYPDKSDHMGGRWKWHLNSM